MANIVNRAGSERDLDPLSLARLQDEERRIRDADEYFARTGINRPPVPEVDPLVDIWGSDDVAFDADSYIENEPGDLYVPSQLRNVNTGEREAFIRRDRITKEKEREDIIKQLKECEKEHRNPIADLEL